MKALSPEFSVTLLEIFKYYDGEHSFYKKLKHHLLPFIPSSINNLFINEQLLALVLISQPYSYWQTVINNSKQKFHTGSSDITPVPGFVCDFYYLEFLLSKHFATDIALAEYVNYIKVLESCSLIDLDSFTAGSVLVPSDTLYHFLEQFYHSEIYSKCL